MYPYRGDASALQWYRARYDALSLSFASIDIIAVTPPGIPGRASWEPLTDGVNERHRSSNMENPRFPSRSKVTAILAPRLYAIHLFLFHPSPYSSPFFIDPEITARPQALFRLHTKSSLMIATRHILPKYRGISETRDPSSTCTCFRWERFYIRDWSPLFSEYLRHLNYYIECKNLRT